jgi:glycosyltransferase involved in cell wall biosynthesis/ubiquinone/menaquinone biosynthesis C-methylase UbiE
MGSRFKLLDDWGIRQYVLASPGTGSSETELLDASSFYEESLRALVDFLEPAFLYERLVPGNTAGASLSQELNIPYIVEYNGSELLMADTFGRSYERRNDFLAAEQAAFAQATVVSAISKGVRDQLVTLGVQPSKILVNPNGVDCDDFRPPTSEERQAIRSRFGWNDDHVVVGFTGTYGGWHGIEELAQALPRICHQNTDVRFLFLGSGNLKNLIDEAVTKYHLYGRVVSTGMVPHEDARTLMQAMDITLAPHAKAIGPSGFFGSPTKVFEYMAVGSAIVASELDQIGEVLQPGIRVADLEKCSDIGQARALLCAPGSVDELVAGVLTLADDPEMRKQFGANARAAAVAHYRWSSHIDRLLNFISGGSVLPAGTISSDLSGIHEGSLQVADADKLEAQIQWDNDPCGSHYVEQSTDRRKFFGDVESYRYGVYGPWMPKLMEFSDHEGERILEVGAGLGTDLAQFALGGAIVTDLELAQGHLELAKENFALRGLPGEFVPGDAENIPFPDGEFDVVYSNGVIHHIPDTQRVIEEMHRVLKPGGKAIVMVYRENSWAYWHNVLNAGLRQEKFKSFSMNEIMSRSFELSDSGARPLVKVYSPKQLRYMFRDFSSIKVFRRQLTPGEVPKALKLVPLPLLERAIGWNLIVKAIR